MFSASSIHLVMDCNLPFILSNVFVISLSLCKTWAFESSKLLTRNKSDFSMSLVFLNLVNRYLRPLWLNYLPDSISFLPAIAIINNGLCRCPFILSLSFSLHSSPPLSFGGGLVSGHFSFLKSSPGNYVCLFRELSSYHTTGFSFTPCFWPKMLFSDTLNKTVSKNQI